MATISTKVAKRLSSTIKRYQSILETAKARDLNESDTVTILTDILADVFGYDKYNEITTEKSIRGTFCDLAIKIEGQFKFLLEAKAIGLELKEAFIKQAVDYGSNDGIEWIVLTNGVSWKVFKIIFGKPISHELVLEFNFLELSHKDDDHLQQLFVLSKEGWDKSAINQHFMRKQTFNRYSLGAVTLSDPVVQVIRRELKRLNTDVKIEIEEIKDLLMNEVLRREVVEGERSEHARKQINRATNKKNKSKNSASEDDCNEILASNLVEEV